MRRNKDGLPKAPAGATCIRCGSLNVSVCISAEHRDHKGDERTFYVCRDGDDCYRQTIRNTGGEYLVDLPGEEPGAWTWFEIQNVAAVPPTLL